MMRVLDLFAGIGGFSLGLERTGGFQTVAFCEIEPYAQKVLAKHWPDVPIYSDVKELTGERLRSDGITVDVITGGFPCQDISHAGKGAGLAGERSGLWSEIARLAGELRPRYIIVENVSALLSRGLGTVLGDLAEIGYDCEWHCIPASHVGAPHQRDRIWIIAYPQHPDSDSAGPHRAKMHLDGSTELFYEQKREPGQVRQDVADAEGRKDNRRKRRDMDKEEECREGINPSVISGSEDVADTNGKRLEGVWSNGNTEGWQEQVLGQAGLCHRASDGQGWWEAEPNVGRVANGVPSRVDRLRCLGNAVVPQIPELIGNAILEHEKVKINTGT